MKTTHIIFILSALSLAFQMGCQVGSDIEKPTITKNISPIAFEPIDSIDSSGKAPAEQVEIFTTRKPVTTATMDIEETIVTTRKPVTTAMMDIEETIMTTHKPVTTAMMDIEETIVTTHKPVTTAMMDIEETIVTTSKPITKATMDIEETIVTTREPVSKPALDIETTVVTTTDPATSTISAPPPPPPPFVSNSAAEPVKPVIEGARPSLLADIRAGQQLKKPQPPGVEKQPNLLDQIRLGKPLKKAAESQPKPSSAHSSFNMDLLASVVANLPSESGNEENSSESEVDESEWTDDTTVSTSNVTSQERSWMAKDSEEEQSDTVIIFPNREQIGEAKRGKIFGNITQEEYLKFEKGLPQLELQLILRKAKGELTAEGYEAELLRAKEASAASQNEPAITNEFRPVLEKVKLPENTDRDSLIKIMRARAGYSDDDLEED